MKPLYFHLQDITNKYVVLKKTHARKSLDRQLILLHFRNKTLKVSTEIETVHCDGVYDLYIRFVGPCQ